MVLGSENTLDTDMVPNNLALKTMSRIISGIIQDMQSEVVHFEVVKDIVNNTAGFLIQLFPVSVLTALHCFEQACSKAPCF